MTNTNTAEAATLNVASTGGKTIYANNEPLTVNSRFNWRANTVQKFVFDGQYWRMDDDSVKMLATAYITEIDEDGIMVHPEGDSTSGWAISDAIQLFKDGISYIKLWIENNIPKIRIGKEDQGHLILDDDSVDIMNQKKTLASFGRNIQIGQTNDTRMTFSNLGFTIYDYQGNETGRIGSYATKDVSVEYEWVTVGKHLTIVDFPSNLSLNKEIDIIGCDVVGNLSIPANSPYHLETENYTVTYEVGKKLDIYIPGASDISSGIRWYINVPSAYGATFGRRDQNATVGDRSVSVGDNNNVGYRSSGAIGTALKTTAMDQVVIGCGNTANQNHAFEIGNGGYIIDFTNDEYYRDEEDISDAFAVTWDGNVELALDTTASSGITDANLYDAIVALGWQDDVIIKKNVSVLHSRNY